MDLILGTEQNLILALYLVSIWSNIWFPGAIFIRHREDLLCQYFEDLADSSHIKQRKSLKNVLRNIYLNSETLLTFFIGGGKRGWAVGMWVRVRDHCLRLFSTVLCIFLLQVCHLWEYLRFGSKLDFIFASGHNGEKLGKLLLHDLANVRLHCLEEHLKSTFHSVVLNWTFLDIYIVTQFTRWLTVEHFVDPMNESGNSPPEWLPFLSWLKKSSMYLYLKRSDEGKSSLYLYLAEIWRWKLLSSRRPIEDCGPGLWENSLRVHQVQRCQKPPVPLNPSSPTQ